MQKIQISVKRETIDGKYTFENNYHRRKMND